MAPTAKYSCVGFVTQFTYYRWRKEFGGLKGDQVKHLKELEKENDRLRKAVSDLTLEKLILKEAADKHVHDSRLGVRFLNVVVAPDPMPTPTT